MPSASTDKPRPRFIEGTIVLKPNPKKAKTGMPVTNTQPQPVEIDMDDEDLPSGDDRAKTDGEDTDKRTDLDMGDDGEVVESKEDLFNFDPSTVHTMFKKEPKCAEWEAGASANKLSGLRGTSLSSEEEQSGQSSKDEHVPIHGHKANRGWPSTCNYVPTGSGRRMVRLSKQPDDLQAIVKVTISKVIGDAVHQDAYCQINGLISYYRHILWRSAKKSLHVMPFAKQFEQDPEFGKTFAWVLNGRVSMYWGQVRRVATGKVEGYYQLLAGRKCVLKVKALLENSSYIYPTKPVRLSICSCHFDGFTLSLL
ncbi:hypothetical protein EI94DRAFT_1704331 [Lactarius quietus]|nr:hypothetical protein EI94DRAFT_1704331 [Lactarius quietus]